MRRWLDAHGMVPKKFVCFPSADPHLMLNGWIMYPPAMDSTKKYPVLIYQYNGPGYQTVMDRWGGRNDLYHAMLAQNGIIVVSVDTRGTGGRGKAFRTLTYKRLGGPETEDLHRVGAYLASLPYVDGSRIGIWGWSYGGFMASNAILRAGDVFSMAIAVAPVTDWRFYDTVYTERYMQTPDDNPDGYELNAPLHYADELKGAFLLIHGTADDNVHVQNSYRLAKALQEAGKDFDMMIYPDKNHGIYGGQTRYQLYKRMYRFLKNQLKK
jgi:dipeptidyl-peptidase-4